MYARSMNNSSVTRIIHTGPGPSKRGKHTALGMDFSARIPRKFAPEQLMTAMSWRSFWQGICKSCGVPSQRHGQDLSLVQCIRLALLTWRGKCKGQSSRQLVVKDMITLSTYSSIRIRSVPNTGRRIAWNSANKQAKTTKKKNSKILYNIEKSKPPRKRKWILIKYFLTIGSTTNHLLTAKGYSPKSSRLGLTPAQSYRWRLNWRPSPKMYANGYGQLVNK